jgi:hypothetical protein
MPRIAPSGSARRLLRSRVFVRGALAVGVALAVASSGLVAGGTPAGARSEATSSQAGADSSSWVGVGELLVVKLSPTGAVSAAPYQHTEVTASSTGTVKVEVPMSASGMRLLAGNKPPVKNGVAQFSFTPNGTATQNVRSDFAGQVPLTVKVTYELNGQPIQASALAPTKHFLKKHYKSGTLKVTYVISNVTSAKTTVSFEGFNGAHITKTITDPLPMVAEMKLTFPSDATAINAPGASLATGKGGVKATWYAALAPPLTGASQSISYSVHLSQAKAPDATVEAAVLVPQSTPSGKIPQSVAAALASVEGQAEQGLGGSPESLGQVRSDTSRPQRSTNSKLAAQEHALTHDNKSKGASLGKVQSSIDQGATTQASDEQNTVALGDAGLNGLLGSGNAQLNGLRDTGDAQLNGLRGVGDAQLNGVRDTANQAIAVLASEVATGSAQANASVGAVLQFFMAELASAIASLGTLISAHVAGQSSAVGPASVLTMAASALEAVVSGLVTVVNQHSTDATALDQLIVQLIEDANAFPAPVQSTPEWIKLLKDLTAAKAKADLVSSVAADIAQRAAAISTAVQELQNKAADLEAAVQHLAAEAAGIKSKLANDVMTAEQNLESTIAHVSGKVQNFQAQIAAAQAKIGQKISSVQATIDQATSGVRARIDQATSNAQAKVGQATSSLKATLNAAGQKASADLAAAKQKVQASVQQAVGSVQSALNKANSDYAQLLAIIQIAQAHQLPGGNATGANVQNSGYVFRISGTG